MSRLLSAVADLLFPPRCVFCDEVVRAGEVACLSCIEGLSRMQGELCFVCGKQRQDCVCTPEPFFFRRCVAPFAYDGRVKRGIIDLKRSARSVAIGFFGREMAMRVRADYAGIPFDTVTYVPSAPDSERGFNQAALLAEVVARELEIMCIAPPVAKVSGSAAQHTQNLAGRMSNARMSYIRGEGGIKGRVLMVDDVMTTGATMSRCASIMCEAGAGEVYCVAAAATLRQEIRDDISPDIDLG